MSIHNPYGNPNAGKLPHEQTATQIDMRRVSPEVAGKCLKIAEKVLAIMRARRPDTPVDYANIAVDLAVIHTHGRPLQLENMMFAADDQLLTDVAMIAMHVDRHTGKLPDFVKLNYEAPRSGVILLS